MDHTTLLRSQLDIMTKLQTEAMTVSTTQGVIMYFVFVVNFSVFVILNLFALIYVWMSYDVEMAYVYHY